MSKKQNIPYKFKCPIYVKQNILFLNDLIGKTFWRFPDHVLLNNRWRFGVFLSLSAYVYDPAYIGSQYNKKSYMVGINTRYICK
jgi:hypothetical protein